MIFKKILKYKLKLRKAIVVSFMSSIVCLTTLNSCKKLVEVDPPTLSITRENVYSTDATAAAVLTDIYARLSSVSGSFATGAFSTSNSLSVLGGLSADEFTLYSNNVSNLYLRYYRNDLASLSGTGAGFEFWINTYKIVYQCNAALEGLKATTSLTTNVKQQLIGEALFIRGLCFFYLTNLYGPVPLTLTTQYEKNTEISRSPVDQVYSQIIQDLTEAQAQLSEKFLKGNGFDIYDAGSEERVRPTKWAASALLARAYLYNGDWMNAELQTTKVLNNTSLFSLPTLANAFKKNSVEAIWQLQPVVSGFNTYDGVFFTTPVSGPSLNNPVLLSADLLNAFEAGDQRRIAGNWVGLRTVGTNNYYYTSKYKINTFNSSVKSPDAMSEYLMVLRLAEQYLIRAEARAQQNKISEAQSDLNEIRKRAGLLSTTAATKEDLLNAILQERRVELFSEWGHRWLDLKRTNKIDAVMAVAATEKGGVWSAHKAFFPIPLVDIERNPNLIQNQGY